MVRDLKIEKPLKPLHLHPHKSARSSTELHFFTKLPSKPNFTENFTQKTALLISYSCLVSLKTHCKTKKGIKF